MLKKSMTQTEVIKASREMARIEVQRKTAGKVPTHQLKDILWHEHQRNRGFHMKVKE